MPLITFFFIFNIDLYSLIRTCLGAHVGCFVVVFNSHSCPAFCSAISGWSEVCGDRGRVHRLDDSNQVEPRKVWKQVQYQILVGMKTLSLIAVVAGAMAFAYSCVGPFLYTYSISHYKKKGHLRYYFCHFYHLYMYV